MLYNIKHMRTKKLKKQTVLEYLAVFQEEKEGGYSVWVPDLPGCASQGENFEEALKNIKEAITLYVEDSPVKKDQDSDYKRQFTVPIKIPYA
jgi:predicted RNase H-like HicB family nuclease